MSEARSRFGVLKERNYLIFLTGYSFSYILYWVTLLAIGWWMWEITKSAAWVGFVFFCDLFPAIFITPWASTLADRGDRFKILKTVLWIQVVMGFALSAFTFLELLTPWLLIIFVLIEGAMVGFSQPAFFGLINRIVSTRNLASAVALNTSITQVAYILGPLLAGFVFSFGLKVAPLAFILNAIGTLVYLFALSRLVLAPPIKREVENTKSLKQEILVGISVFWQNKIVLNAIIFILICSLLQRPIISLMTGINDEYDLFRPAYFTLLTASYMLGSVTASLSLASRNNETGLSSIFPFSMAATIVLYASFFYLLAAFNSSQVLALTLLFIVGFGECFTRTGNFITLQTKTPEHLRSRVLGNTFMFNRAVGALAVVSTGLLIDMTSFTTGFIGIAIFALLAMGCGLLAKQNRT